MPDVFVCHPIKDYSWQNIYFQIPTHLFVFICFLLAQSMMVLISLFLVLRYLKRPEPQHEAVLIAVILVVLAPPLIYYFGRFRRYLSETKGLIWWEDLKSSFCHLDPLDRLIVMAVAFPVKRGFYSPSLDKEYQNRYSSQTKQLNFRRI